MDNSIYEKTDHYISHLLAPEDTALKKIPGTLQEKGIGNMSISPNQGKFLQVMAAACNAKKVLELGTFAGYSTIWLARALPPDGKVITIESDQHHAEIAKEHIIHAGAANKVEIRTGLALEILATMVEENSGPFDLIFMDADKPPYAAYFQYALKLSRPGTIIIADNVIRNGMVLDPHSPDERVQGVQRFNQLLSECKEVTAIIIPSVGLKEFDGMAVAVVNHQ